MEQISVAQKMKLKKMNMFNLCETDKRMQFWRRQRLERERTTYHPTKWQVELCHKLVNIDQSDYGHYVDS